MMKINFFSAIGLFLTSLSTTLFSAPNLTDWQALQQANQQFVNNPTYIQQRADTAAGQNPTYVVLSCADSRTPPEIIFNQGLGRIFSPRVAGNTAGDQVIDSIGFAVHTWDVTTLVVMGHENCGAVVGALDLLRENNGKIRRPHGIFDAVLFPIEKAIVKAGIDIYASDALEQSINANVEYAAKQLIKKSPIIAKALKNGQIVIVGAVYGLSSGEATQLFIIDQHSVHRHHHHHHHHHKKRC
jgi:carbonic anhydrase